MKKKELYLVPETEVHELRLEGGILTTSDPNSTGDNFDWDD